MELIYSLAHTYSSYKGGFDLRGQSAHDRRDALMRKSACGKTLHIIQRLTSAPIISNSLHDG